MRRIVRRLLDDDPFQQLDPIVGTLCAQGAPISPRRSWRGSDPPRGARSAQVPYSAQ
jgi:hypothetical protein